MNRREPPPAAPAAPLQRPGSGVRQRPRPRRTNLTSFATTFVGREKELSELRALLGEDIVTTVVGPAGIGKTRLAMELSRAVLGEYSEHGGVWRINLSDAEDLEATCSAVARTLTLQAAATGRDPVGSLGAVLAKRGKMLVVLDGADGCRADVATALGRWREAAPNIRWIATCQTPLGVAGERAQSLGPLPTAPSRGHAPDALSLLFERMRPARGRPALDGQTVQRLLLVVQRLGASPLAIELAAGAPHAFSPEPLAYDPLHGAGLRAAIDAACGALAPLERRTLAHLSVFAGGFDREGARAVLATSEGTNAAPREAMEAIETLQHRFLLVAEHGPDLGAGGRYWMPRSVRDYILERRVDSGAVDSAGLRHARYYVERGTTWARRHDEGDTGPSAAWLTRETENLLAAYRRALPRGVEGAVLALGAALSLDRVLALVGPAAMRWRLLGGAIAAADAAEVRSPALSRAVEALADARRRMGSDRPHDVTETGRPPDAAAKASADAPGRAPPNASANALVVGSGGGWFRVPGGPIVDLSRWGPLQRLLHRLAERREAAPGEPLSVDALVAAGWPGERVLPKAGATRVYTAIASLRRLGLRDLLVRTDRGYLLRPSVGIERTRPP
jgi:hypothetical protein